MFHYHLPVITTKTSKSKPKMTSVKHSKSNHTNVLKIFSMSTIGQFTSEHKPMLCVSKKSIITISNRVIRLYYSLHGQDHILELVQ